MLVDSGLRQQATVCRERLAAWERQLRSRHPETITLAEYDIMRRNVLDFLPAIRGMISAAYGLEADHDSHSRCGYPDSD